MMAHTIIDLLENNAKRGKEVVKNFVPTFKKNDYLAYLRNLSKEEEFSYKNLKI